MYSRKIWRGFDLVAQQETKNKSNSAYIQPPYPNQMTIQVYSDYVLYQHFKKHICILPRECNISLFRHVGTTVIIVVSHCLMIVYWTYWYMMGDSACVRTCMYDMGTE